MAIPPSIAGALINDEALWDDFNSICDCGGRVAGTPSERQALDLTARLGAAASGQKADVSVTPYSGWHCRSASVELLQGDRRTSLTCQPLLLSKAGSVEAEVLPVGRGTEAEFAAAGERLRGRIALVRHEYMFAAGHIHRRNKLAWALGHGAVGFLIAGPLACSPVAGGAGPDLLAFGISPEAAARLSPENAPLARARLTVDADHAAAETEAQHFHVPGSRPGCVVLSAHVDGHGLAESAMDNATGVAVALAVTRCLAPHVANASRGLKLGFYSAEEWALTGSRVWLAQLSEAERAAIVLNVNLDSVGGGRRLTALISEFPNLEPFVRKTAFSVGVHLPLMMNSDHANFAAHGIPALRLVAGFDDPSSDIRHVLTAADTRDKVTRPELQMAALAAAELVWAALHAPADEVAAWRSLKQPR
ncbi:MAG TPA: M28 family peptidase [Tardiphaga sp.]